MSIPSKITSSDALTTNKEQFWKEPITIIQRMYRRCFAQLNLWQILVLALRLDRLCAW